MSNIVKGNLNGISSKGGYYKDGKFVPNPVSETDPLYILYGYPVASTGSGTTIEAGTKSNMTYEDDGHGVVTSRVTYYGSSPKEIANGASHPKIGSLKCFRSSVSQDGKVYTTTAEYIGLANGSNASKIVFSGDFGVGSAPIKLNPKWKELANNPDIGWDATKNEFIDAQGLYNLAGVKSFYTSTLTLSGYFYTNSPGVLKGLIGKVGRITNSLDVPGEDFGFYGSLPFSGGKFCTYKYFVSGVSHEQIAHLYKVKFSIIYAGGGWNTNIYETA